MSRKGVGRGRRYTVRVNRDGSQQYKRRGCGASILLAVLAVVAVVLLAACDPEPVPKPGRGLRTPVVEKVNVANVKSLCDYVAAFVDSEEARGNVGVKAEMTGVPDSLERKAKDFANAPTDTGKSLVLLECATAGWVH